jgi:hypothetical protein
MILVVVAACYQGCFLRGWTNVQGDVKDEFKRQHATVMWALYLLSMSNAVVRASQSESHTTKASNPR